MKRFIKKQTKNKYKYLFFGCPAWATSMPPGPLRSLIGAPNTGAVFIFDATRPPAMF